MMKITCPARKICLYLHEIFLGQALMNRFFNKPIGLFLLALLSLMGLGAAVYAYTGPDRTRTEPVEVCKVVLLECQKVPAKGDYRYKQVRDWSCSNESKPWQDYPSQPPPSGCYEKVAGPSNVYWSREYRVDQIPVTHPPAEISAQPLCSLPGQNGWCRNGALLQLTGHEPVSGYSIFALGGTRNGELFSLQAATGSIPVLEGRNDFEYWAYST